MRRQVATAVLLLLVLLPAGAEAQRGRGWRSNPWSFSPWAGVFRDAYDVSADGDDTGWQLGFRLGYDLGGRTRLVGTLGYAESDDVASNPSTLPYYVYDNQYIITTGGAEYDILPGNTSVSLGVELGGLWREVAFDHVLGGEAVNDVIEDAGYTFHFAVAPALVVRHGFTSRTALELGVRDYLLPDGQVDHFPALSVGFRFR